MPEGDTIWRTAQTLRERLVPRSVTAVRPAALARLERRSLRQVEPAGKHLYMHFDGGVVLHTHMRMTGAWHVYSAGEPWRRAAHRATAVLEFGDRQAVLFAAPVCELLAATAARPHLGPDILAARLDLADVARRARTAAVGTIAEVLLDQQTCAGIGNIYRCEALWHERVDPFAAPALLAEEVVGRVYRRARDLMRRNAVGGPFRATGAVHGRSGRPCRRCGAFIRTAGLGSPSRILYWCPTCQQEGNGVESR